jgi:lipopolysaccharide biosynthesis regulator YciM|tara:strand:+ start:125 stop:421 length:297 start_codon:yes stop_codon:yes gene_type:complete
MNPYVDLLGWGVVVLCTILLCVEVYFLVRWIRAEARFKKKSLAEVYFENNVEVDGTGRVCDMECKHCGYTTSYRLWHRCPSCGSNHQPVACKELYSVV